MASPSPSPDPEEAPETSFVAAPVPPVNIWHQRKEKNETKFKPAGPPRPVDDSTLWPTLDLAQDEEKRKAQEKLGKPDKDRNANGTVKAHGKEKWTVVPYTPTAVFETQISRRGGRPTRGGRDGAPRGASHAFHAGGAGEKTSNGTSMAPSAGGTTGDVEEPGRNDSTLGKATSSSYKAPKKIPRGGGAQAPREPRRSNQPAGFEKRTDTTDMNPKNGDAQHPPGNSTVSRRTSISTQTEPTPRFRQDSRSHSRRDSAVSQNHFQSPAQRPERYRANTADSHAHPRPPYSERRGSGKPMDHPPDAGGAASAQRGDGRPERGRGGHRGGRGGGVNGFVAQQIPPHNHRPRNMNGYPPSLSKASSAGSQGKEAHQQQTTTNSYPSGPHPPRNYRSGSGHRSHSIPSSATFGGFSGYPVSPLPMAPLKTQIGSGYDFPAMPPMSAMPYMPYVEQYSAMSMVSMQLEYYFSVDNLCKDLYLRKHMDSQGFVALNFIARFNRIQQLTPEIEMVRSACYYSPIIEIRLTSDGTDRVRKKEGWEQWVLTISERDPSAQNEGPSEAQLSWDHPAPEDRSQYSPYGVPTTSQVGSPSQKESPSKDKSPVDNDPSKQPPLPSATTNGNVNGDPHASQTPVTQTPLSAAVPDFSPGMIPVNGNGVLSLNGGDQKQAFKKTSNLIRAKLAESSRPLESQLQPIYARNPPRQPIHPAAYLRQSKGRWYTTHSAVNAAIRRFTSSAKLEARGGVKYDRSSFPKSSIGAAVTRLPSRTPFASTLRPNLTGGTLSRSAGGYTTGSGRIGGARYFSHTPAAPAQVVSNVSAAIRAFALSGQKAQFAGAHPITGEKRYTNVSPAQDEIGRKLRSLPRVVPGSVIDFEIPEIVVALGARADGHPNAFTMKIHENLIIPAVLSNLSTDRSHKDFARFLSDLTRLFTLGELEYTQPRASVFRVRFPGCDAESVERLCDELCIQRGVVRQDAEFDTYAGTELALKFPFAPSDAVSVVPNHDRLYATRAKEQQQQQPLDWTSMLSSARTGSSDFDHLSTRSHAGQGSEAGTDLENIQSPSSSNPAPLCPSSALSDYSSLHASEAEPGSEVDDARVYAYFTNQTVAPQHSSAALGMWEMEMDMDMDSQGQRQQDSVTTEDVSEYEGLEGIYRFIQQCDSAAAGRSS
ncbi:MAG: hypothetical protein M1837_004121 [Sclerophora amabilis]|nr:MAG: hypothetical protein M1837_004121 [Sclerophora amabilis]